MPSLDLHFQIRKFAAIPSTPLILPLLLAEPAYSNDGNYRPIEGHTHGLITSEVILLNAPRMVKDVIWFGMNGKN
jgi:hypothetical protein